MRCRGKCAPRHRRHPGCALVIGQVGMGGTCASNCKFIPGSPGARAIAAARTSNGLRLRSHSRLRIVHTCAAMRTLFRVIAASRSHPVVFFSRSPPALFPAGRSGRESVMSGSITNPSSDLPPIYKDPATAVCGNMNFRASSSMSLLNVYFCLIASARTAAGRALISSRWRLMLGRLTHASSPKTSHHCLSSWTSMPTKATGAKRRLVGSRCWKTSRSVCGR